MTASYRTIFADLMEDEPEAVNYPDISILGNCDSYTRIQLLKTYYMKAKLRKKRQATLYYLYQIGKEIYEYGLSEKNCGLSKHFYQLTRRIFLLFEHDEAQIMRMKKTTTTLISKLSNNEFRSLINVDRTPTLVGEDVTFPIDSNTLPLST